jgi:hypothetical protein
VTVSVPGYVTVGDTCRRPRRTKEQQMSTTPQEPLNDDDIETTGSTHGPADAGDADGADGQDAPAGGDGDSTDSTDGDSTDGADADGTDGGDADGTDA